MEAALHVLMQAFRTPILMAMYPQENIKNSMEAKEPIAIVHLIE